MINDVHVTGKIVTPVQDFCVSSRSEKKYISFRVINEREKGNLVEKVFFRVNVYNRYQCDYLRNIGLQEGDKVYIKGELMSRGQTEGKDDIEIRGLHVDAIS